MPQIRSAWPTNETLQMALCMILGYCKKLTWTGWYQSKGKGLLQMVNINSAITVRHCLRLQFGHPVS